MRGGVLEARSARRRAVAEVRTKSESGPADARHAGVLGKPEKIGGALAQMSARLAQVIRRPSTRSARAGS